MREFFVRQNLSIRAILGAIRAIWMVCPPFENFPVRLCIKIPEMAFIQTCIHIKRQTEGTKNYVRLALGIYLYLAKEINP